MISEPGTADEYLASNYQGYLFIRAAKLGKDFKYVS